MKRRLPSFFGWRQKTWRWMWLALVASCLAFCARGLAAQSAGNAKTSGRVAPNAGIAGTRGDAPSERGPRSPRLLREQPPVDDVAPAADEPSASPAPFRPEPLVSPRG